MSLESGSPRGQPIPPVADRLERTRRGFLGALLAAIGSALAIGVLWLISRGASSAGRDPAWRRPAEAETDSTP